jgi:hypothetical protein
MPIQPTLVMSAPSEENMQYSPVMEPVSAIQPEGKPRLTSHDSGQECSLEHLLAVYRLVEKQDVDLDGYVFDDSCLLVSQ